MAYNSNIEWTHHTANLWWGCTEVHAGCDNCYARVWANRYGDKWGDDAARRPIKSVWGNLLGMQAKAAAAGEVHRVFVGSMMDIFEKNRPINAEDPNGPNLDFFRTKFFTEIVPNSPNLLFLLLTKRPSLINRTLANIVPLWLENPPKNVMFGASIVNPETALDVARHMNKVNGRIFYSVEPQLSFINFDNNDVMRRIEWLIQGGESGPKRRPFDTNWARHTKAVCEERNVLYFFKQIDKIQPIPEDLQIRQVPSLLS